MHRIDHGLKHRQAAGRQSNASPDHDTVVSLSRERPLYLGSGCFIGLNQAQVRAPSAFGHMLQGQGNAGMDFLGVRARRKYGVSEIHGLWLLPYEQNMRHLIILRVCATSRALLLRGTYTRIGAALYLSDEAHGACAKLKISAHLSCPLKSLHFPCAKIRRIRDG